MIATKPLLTSLVALTLAASPAGAVTQGTLSGGGELEVPSGPQPRSLRATDWNRTPARQSRAWESFKLDNGAQWTAIWDRGTGAPHRIFGKGIAAPGSVASAGAAQAHARTVLGRYIDLLAPGASASDFSLVANEVHRGLRSVSFQQHWQGLEVLGGHIAFQYKADRLIVIGSQALPHVSLPRSAGGPIVADGAARQVARAWMLQDVAYQATPMNAVSKPFILPLVRGHTVDYRKVVRTRVQTARPSGDWSVFVDAHTGRAVARKSRVAYGSGQVLYNTPIRRPDDARQSYPAPGLDVTISGAAASSDSDGVVTWVGEEPVELTLGVGGDLVLVENKAGDPAQNTVNLSSGGQTVWNQSEDELVDAQLTSYIHAHIAKTYARTFAPALAMLDDKLIVNVNLEEECNAFYEPNGSINFFQSSSNCQNTGRLPDVVYHEFGHALHAASIIDGVGAFDSAFSEGLSDYFAATITGDPGMGRGFFYGNEALREIDPEGTENRWPDDIGEIHFTGLIFAGAMWDLRKELIELYGMEDGIALADRLFYAAVQTAADIPSTYVSVITEDDDDGDLSNGTPNICTINAVFGLHGLRELNADIAGLAAELPSPEGHPVTMTLSGLYDECPGDDVVAATLTYNGQETPEETTTIELEDLGERTFAGVVPTPGEPTVIEYQVQVEFADGSLRRFPENIADTRYQFYVGETVELYCTDFEGADPFANGWEHGLAEGEETEGADDWQWGTPAGISGSGDPARAYSGDSVIGNDLGAEDFNGKYQANKINFALSPVIDIGRYSDVRLQYRRWLHVEDGFFDRASIYVDEFLAWQNYDSDSGNNSKTHHRDLEWRFHDVSLSPFITDSEFRLKFEIASDAGLEFGGWTIDDVCVVADANSICGDGRLSGAEDCDDGVGNSNALANACRENCRVAGCGDGVRDDLEQCDDGNLDNGDGCDSACQVESKADCGLSVTGNRSAPLSGTLILLSMFLVLGVRRRRRRWPGFAGSRK